jgi:hypothetical protein
LSCRSVPAPPGIAESTISFKGRVSESQFRKAVVWLVAGTLLALLLLAPSALLIVQVARLL